MKTRLNVNIDDELKAQTGAKLNELGLDYTTAVTIYFKQILAQGKIPFEITTHRTYSADEVLGTNWDKGLEQVEDEWE